MKHVTIEQYRECYDKLPLTIRKLTDNNFTVIKQYPEHPLLRLMRCGEFVSMRVGSRCRALAVEEGETTIWFWIGTYKQYAALFQ
jgi:hypothetical protein